MSERDFQLYLYLYLSSILSFCAIACWLLFIGTRGVLHRYFLWALSVSFSALSMWLLAATAGERPFALISDIREYILAARIAMAIAFSLLALQLLAKLRILYTGRSPKWLYWITRIGVEDVI